MNLPGHKSNWITWKERHLPEINSEALNNCFTIYGSNHIEIVSLIVCYRAFVTYAECAMHAPMIIHYVASWILCCSISQDAVYIVCIERQPRPRDVPPSI